MMKPTLEDPDIVLLEQDKPSDKKHDRESKLLFVKTFTRNGKKVVHFESATIRKEGLEISISSHIVQPDELIKKLTNDGIVYNKKVSDNGSERHLTKDSKSLPDLVPTQSDNLSTKVQQNSENASENEKNISNEPSYREEVFCGEIDYRRKTNIEEVKKWLKDGIISLFYKDSKRFNETVLADPSPILVISAFYWQSGYD